MNSSEINSIIDNLAEKLSVPVSVLNETLLKQAKVSMVQNILWLLVYCVCIYIILKYFFFMFKKNEDGDTRFDEIFYDSTAVGFSTVGVAVLGVPALIVFAILSVNCVNSILTCAMNPQWYVIKTILQMISK